MADYTTNKTAITSVQPGRTFDKVDENNYLDITRRLVHLEQILSGKIDSNNAPSIPPIGSIMAWHKSFTNTPALPSNWVECNGQTLSDTSSLYNDKVIPNLNGAAAGADLNSGDNLGKTGDVFLRGDETSGTTQFDNIQGHKHALSGFYPYTNGGSTYSFNVGASSAGQTSIGVDTPITDGINGTPRTGSLTRPRNMSVVWIMRIK